MSDAPTPRHRCAPYAADGEQGLVIPAAERVLLGLLRKCRCGARFWTRGGYRGHYALTHVLRAD